jgi:hypothetical protein
MAFLLQSDYTAWFQSAKNVTLTNAQLTFLGTILPWVESVAWQVIGYPLPESEFTEFLPAGGTEKPPVSWGIDIGWDMMGGVAVPQQRGGWESQALQLSRLPVRSITSVYEYLAAWSAGTANGDWPSTALLPASAYRLDMAEVGICRSGRLVRQWGAWTTAARAVKVTYTHGYTAAEILAGTDNLGVVKIALNEALGWWWGKAMRRSQAIKSNMLSALQLSIRDFSATLGDPSQIGNQNGAWASAILGPESLGILMNYVNMNKYFG